MERQIRARMVEAMRETVMNEPRWHYEESRPLELPDVNTAYHGTVYSDCSFGCVILAHLAGAPDPSGTGFRAPAGSSAMFAFLPHLRRAQIQPGDYVVFGPDGGQHAACVYELATDPVVWSHGQEKGPVLVRLSVEIAAHSGPVTFLRAVPADPVKKPATKKTPQIHGEPKNDMPFTRRYYTLKRNVPLRHGQTVRFAPGHGYYAA